MDILKDKQSKSYEYISRYSSTLFAYNTKDCKYIYELTNQLKDTTQYIIVKVEESTTLDNLAAKYYGRPDYFWAIADFNRIQDPFIKLSEHFTEIKIPAITGIEYED